MSGDTILGVVMVAGITFAVLGSIVGLLFVALAGRRGPDGAWDSHPPRQKLRLRAGGGLGRGSSH
ncbi:MAG TPA: hypothetical protein VFX53_09735 [Pedococcus sp.]|nr:hypothetical protein [Pedococcus sp.]